MAVCVWPVEIGQTELRHSTDLHAVYDSKYATEHNRLLNAGSRATRSNLTVTIITTIWRQLPRQA